MEIKIPYGKEFMVFDAPDARVKAVLSPRKAFCADATGSLGSSDSLGLPDSMCATDTGKPNAGRASTEEELVSGALSNPIGSLPLHELAAGKHKVTIITSDHTRPMPSRTTMPMLLEEVRRGSPVADITILVATGLHRATTDEELRERFGEEICGKERIIVHDCRDEASLRDIGTLPSGRPLALSRHALDADLLIAEGFVEPHFFAGFSGGRKSVFPGVAGYECVVSNHSSDFISNRNARAGILEGNPIHMDMAFAAKKAKLAFILNVILDEGRSIIGAVAGDPETAHAEGCAQLMKDAAVEGVCAPIVVTSNGGYPLDQNLYQLVKCIDTAEKCCEEGGVIIAVGECIDGIGGEAFYNDFSGGAGPGDLGILFSSRAPAETQTDQWQSQILARILEKHRVVVVSPLIKDALIEMRLDWAETPNDAVSKADAMLETPSGKAADIVVIPNGLGVVIL